MKLKKIAALVLWIALANANHAHAFVVFDPTNLVQNSTSAAAAVKNEINTATILIKQIESTIALARSLASVKNLASLTGLEKELALYQDLKQASMQLASIVDESQRLSTSLQSQYGASSLSFKDFSDQKSRSNAATDSAMAAQYRTVTASMSEVAQRRRQIVGQLQNSEGQTAALQAVGAAIDVLIGQNQQVISTMSAEGQTRIADKRIEQGSQKQGMKIISDRQTELEQSIAKFK